ncbi:MAG TPA: tyrosine-type recombinase/integrase [Chloroflexota bacterium]|nr:tyrosine-type recombinase/integrase [Chloroflexota bacterium]
MTTWSSPAASGRHSTRTRPGTGSRRRYGRRIDRIRQHDLWHTTATLMLTEGVHPKVVQEMLGHANISITLTTYSHVLPTMQGTP